MKSFSLWTYRRASPTILLPTLAGSCCDTSSETTEALSLTITDPPVSVTNRDKIKPGLGRPKPGQVVLTSSAGLDDDDLGFVHQGGTFLGTQVFVNVVDGEFIWFFLAVVDPKDIFAFPMRHDHHKHAVGVPQLWMLCESVQNLIDPLCKMKMERI